MEFIGYLKEHESGFIKMGVSIKDVKPSYSPLLMKYYAEVLNYLEKAPILMGAIRCIDDENGETIGPLIFRTDGYWIWPSYLIYYLSKGYHSLMSDRFIQYMLDAKFKLKPFTAEEWRGIEKFYADAYQIKGKY